MQARRQGRDKKGQTVGAHKDKLRVRPPVDGGGATVRVVQSVQCNDDARTAACYVLAR